MKKEKTFEERYQELKALVPEHLRKEFELIESGERLPELTGDIPTNYLVVLMKESPKLFKDNPSFIHHKMEVTDTGVELTSLAKIVYIELDKCLQQVRENTYPKDKEELCFLLAFMADVNGETAKDLAKTNPSYSAIQTELANMNKDKEAMLAMLADKYEEIIHNSEIKQARDEGMDIGEKKGIAIGEKKGIAIGEKKGIAIGEKNALTRTLTLINLMIQNGQGDDIPRLQTDPVFLDEMFSKYSIK